jgi:hypothetical protein
MLRMPIALCPRQKGTEVSMHASDAGIRKSTRKFRVAALSALCLSFLFDAPVAHGSLIGDTVTCMLGGSTRLGCLPVSGVVGPFPEFGLFAGLVIGQPIGFTADIGAASILLQNTSSGTQVFDPPITLSFGSFDDPAGDLAGIANFATQGTTGVTPGNVSFTAHSVTFLLGNTLWAPGATASVDLVFPAAVSEPSSIALLGIGLAAFALMRRRN